jgi:hypothetical protein
MNFKCDLRKVLRDFERFDNVLDQTIVKMDSLKNEIENTRNHIYVYGDEIFKSPPFMKWIFISSLLDNDEYFYSSILMSFIELLTKNQQYWVDIKKEISDTHWKCYACSFPVSILTMDKCVVNMTHIVLCKDCSKEPIVIESIAITA